MSPRLCLPVVQGRGAGLGNELIPWCRAYLAAQWLGVRPLAPAFGLNQRRYWRHFGGPRWDWAWHRALRLALPTFDFTEADHLRGGGADVVDSFAAYADKHGLRERRAYLVTTTGMWGGYSHIAAARPFAWSVLYRSRFAAHNLLQLRRRLDPTLPVVGLHVRLGDFADAAAPQDYRGRFNIALPLAWYVEVAKSIESALGGEVQFLVTSDGTPEQLRALTDGRRCVLTSDLPDGDCSDLLALAQCDLLVCSVSSYSAWAAFLSDAPYLWYRPNLLEHEEGYLSIWGHEPRQQRADGPTRLAIEAWRSGMPMAPRGWAVGHGEAVPQPAIARMLGHHRERQPVADLLQYGVVPANPAPATWTGTRA